MDHIHNHSIYTIKGKFCPSGGLFQLLNKLNTIQNTHILQM